METYDLVSHGATSDQECYATSAPNAGPGYKNSCIHSGSNDHTGGNTVWYNYVLASADTIFNDIDPSINADNRTAATESICPKGWALPVGKQIDNLKDAANFSPVLGGFYNNATLKYESERGIWWGSESYDNAGRYSLRYINTGSLDLYHYIRNDGIYIRCVSEEKTVLDLTYMQDMTPSSHFSRCRSLYIVN